MATEENGSTPAPKAPPQYGGTKDAPDLGANGRRFVAHLREERGAAKTNAILADAQKRTEAGNGVRLNAETKNFVKTGKGDRFVRWETIAAVAGLKPADALKIVRRLARQEGAKEAGTRQAA